MPMPAAVIRSDGAVAPPLPKTDAGTTIGAATAAAVAVKKLRRDILLLMLNPPGESPPHSIIHSRPKGNLSLES